MRLEPTPRPEHVLRVSARLITSSTILHLSSDELERNINQEQIENPSLEVQEQRVCLFCGTQLHGAVCTTCGHYAQPGASLADTTHYEIASETGWNSLSQPYDSDNYGFAEADADEFDPLARIPTGETLGELLLHELEGLVTPDDALIAEQLVGNLDERGYLEVSIEEISDYLQVSSERVEYVLKQLQTLEPLGIGARNPRECLLIQLQALNESELARPHPLAYTLIDHYLDRLSHGQFHEIGRELQTPEQEIREAYAYIRSTLHPHPAHAYSVDTRYARQGSGALYVRPDVIIRRSENGFEVELIEEKRYSFSVGQGYLTPPHEKTNHEIQRYVHHQGDRAKFFIDCIQRRWRTLKRVAALVVRYQHDFLESGVRSLRPLTRAEIAAHLNLDEGTVSRATANKYALLPNGRLIPFSDFFDSSLGVKDILREIIQTEGATRRLSDEELRRQLSERGYQLARRTVTKYREEMGIHSSRQR